MKPGPNRGSGRSFNESRTGRSREDRQFPGGKKGNLALGLVVQKSGARPAAEKEDRMKIKTAKWVTNWRMEPSAPAPEEGSHLNLAHNKVFALAELKWKQSHAAKENEW
jgi:hypothetical protein